MAEHLCARRLDPPLQDIDISPPPTFEESASQGSAMLERLEDMVG